MKRSIAALALALTLLPLHLAALHAEEKAKPPADDARVRQMIGQMVLVGFVGDKPDDEGFRIVIDQVAHERVGGVIYLGRNIRSLRAVTNLNEQLQSEAKTPLFIAVDQEGGRIERLTKAVSFKESPSASDVARTMKPEEAKVVYAAMAVGLANAGFNLNLGPVVDLNVNPSNPIIGRLGRSFSADPEKVSKYARAFIEAHRAHGVLTALKHFPGHGSSIADTHKGTADVSDTWKDNELSPYRDLIGSGDADMIMSAHVINRNIAGAEGTPASLSPATLTGLLRKTMKFKGVVISDDLQMGAIIRTRSLDETIRQAVLSGNDVLVFANDKHPDPAIPDHISDFLLQEARRNPVMLSRIQESYRRIIRLKGQLETAAVAPAKPN
ncbi:glycoside hydrolase family 3 protein [Rhizobium giardinii]